MAKLMICEKNSQALKPKVSPVVLGGFARLSTMPPSAARRGMISHKQVKNRRERRRGAVDDGPAPVNYFTRKIAKNTMPSAKAVLRIACTRIGVAAPGFRPTASDAFMPMKPTPMAAPRAARPT